MFVIQLAMDLEVRGSMAPFDCWGCASGGSSDPGQGRNITSSALTDKEQGQLCLIRYCAILGFLTCFLEVPDPER